MSAATMLNDMNSDYLRKKSRQSVPIYRPPGARGSRENQASHPHLDDGRNLQRGHYSQPQQFIGNIRGIHEDLQRSQDVPFDNSPGARESKSKRPDRQFYVPRGRRNPLSVSNTPIPLDDVRPPSPADSICSVVSEFRGRNRYDQQISGRSPVYQERKIMGKPPQMPMNYRSPNKGKNTNNLSPESIKLLERCTNTNSSIMHGNKPESYFIDHPSMGKPVSFNQENNSIHSKENRIDRFEFNNPSERKRKNRRRKSKSRDHSLERGRRRGSLSSENLDRNFYTCESVDWKDNIPKWKQNSRNLSIERIPVNTSDGLEWRKKSASNPSTPLKASLNDCRVQESPIVKDLVDVGPGNSHTSPISHLQKSDILCDSVIENDLMSNPPQLEEFKVSHVPFSSQVNEISKDLEGIEVTKECAPLSCISSENESSVQQVSNFNEQFDISANSFLRGKNLSTECNESPQNNNVQIEVHDTKDSSIKTPSKSENEKLENPSTPIKISEVNDVPENPKVFSFNWADEVDNVGGEIDTWDSLYDESGNYVLSEACKGKLNDSIADITLHKPAKDYYEFQPKEVQLSDEEYNHIIEIYDFSSTFQSVDLLVIFQQYKGFSLKWVDDTHALGIFSSSVTATDCLNMVHPFVKTRPLSQASEVSKTKAQRLKESRLPFKPRPETSAALARRLVTGALGLRVSVPREQREAEKMKLKNAKEKRKLVAKQKEEAWEGTLGNLAE